VPSSRLLKLKISIAFTRIDHDALQDSQSVVSFANLRFLQLDGPLTGVRQLAHAIVATELEDVDLVCAGDLDDDATEGDVLYATFDILRRRNATSLRRLRLSLLDVYMPLFPESVTTGAQSSGPGGPLLELCRLQDVEMILSLSDGRYCSYPDILAFVEAWPMLRVLTLPGLVASCRSCHRTLSYPFLLRPPNSTLPLAMAPEIPIQGCLRYFLDSLFPRLDAERSSVPYAPKCYEVEGAATCTTRRYVISAAGMTGISPPG